MLSVYKDMEVIKGNARVGCTQQGGGTGGWRQGHGGGGEGFQNQSIK